MAIRKEAASAAGSSNSSGYVYYLIYRRKFCAYVYAANSALWSDTAVWKGYYPGLHDESLQLEDAEAPETSEPDESLQLEDAGAPETPEAGVDEAGVDERWEVEAIVADRGRGRKRKYRVRWAGFSASEDTWEPAGHLDSQTVKEYNALPG